MCKRRSDFVEGQHYSIVWKDHTGRYRFSPPTTNIVYLQACLSELESLHRPIIEVRRS